MIYIILFLTATLSALEWEPIPLDAPGYEWIEEAANAQISDLANERITRAKLNATWKRCEEKNQKFKKPHFQRFRVINSKIYGPPGQIRNMLSTIRKYYPLPDLGFIWYNQDIVKESYLNPDETANDAPIFVSAKKSHEKNRILFSDWYYDITCQSEEGWNGIIDLLNTQGDRWPWSEKNETLFWRGSPTDGYYTPTKWKTLPRGALVAYSGYRPDLIDAAFTGKSWHTKLLEKLKGLARMAEFCSIIDHTQYKYQLTIDGVTATYPGTQWRLYSNCLNFIQESDDLLWFSHELAPHIHYLPVKHNMSNLIEQIIWAKEHDEEAHLMAIQAKEFAKTHLMPEHILLYCYHVLSKYADLVSH